MEKLTEVIVHLCFGEQLRFSPVDEINTDEGPDVLILHMKDWNKKVIIPFDSFVYYEVE